MQPDNLLCRGGKTDDCHATARCQRSGDQLHFTEQQNVRDGCLSRSRLGKLGSVRVNWMFLFERPQAVMLTRQTVSRSLVTKWVLVAVLLLAFLPLGISGERTRWVSVKEITRKASTTAGPICAAGGISIASYFLHMGSASGSARCGRPCIGRRGAVEVVFLDKQASNRSLERFVQNSVVAKLIYGRIRVHA